MVESSLKTGWKKKKKKGEKKEEEEKNKNFCLSP